MRVTNARTGILVGALSLVTATAQTQEPLPLDPLTASERSLAQSIATRDSTVREFMAARRARLINIDFVALKDPDSGDAQSEVPSRRHAELLFLNYDREQGLRVLVDITRGRVADIVQIPGQSVPINTEEVASASRLALADARVISLFAGRMPAFRVATGPATHAELESARIEGLRVLGGAADDPCNRNRCIALFFRVNNRYVHTNRVVVDLTAQQVLIRGRDER